MALTLHKSKKGNRTLIAEINGEVLEINFSYSGDSNLRKGHLLDAKIIPAILHAVNVKPIKIKKNPNFGGLLFNRVLSHTVK